MKAYKFKLKPNKNFEREATRTLDVCRELYNASIQERRDAYRMNGVSINFALQCAQLPAIKHIRPDLKDVHSQVLQDVLHRSDRAFEAFFRRVKNGQTPGYPRFKGKDRYNSFTYPQAGYKLEGDKLSLSKIGSVRVRLSRPIQGKVKTCIIAREADGWYVVLTVETAPPEPLPKTGETVGIDLGIEAFATLSTGERIENPRHLKDAEGELKTAQRRVSRRHKNSKRRRKAVRLLAKKHQTIRRRRRDFHHKVANDLVGRFDEIKFEKLNVSGMVRNPQLAKAISDVGWASFISVTAYKAEEAGRRVMRVNASGTSQVCSQCGARVPKTLSERRHECPDCGFVAHRDHNAAIEIKNRPGRPVGDGGAVRPPREPRISTDRRALAS